MSTYRKLNGARLPHWQTCSINMRAALMGGSS